MLNAEYLHRQAETCVRIARTTFDLATAERLRFMAAELRAKADEIGDQESAEPNMMKSNGNGSIKARAITAKPYFAIPEFAGRLLKSLRSHSGPRQPGCARSTTR